MRTTARGFSLIELVISIAIITTVAGVASFRFARSADRARVNAAAERIVDMITDARTRSRTTGIATSVTLDNSPPSIRIGGVSRIGLNQTRFDQDPYRVQFTSIDFGGGNILGFDGRGRPATGGSVKVVRGSFVRSIIVDPETGHAEVQ